jgi:hypothetical protein
LLIDNHNSNQHEPTVFKTIERPMQQISRPVPQSKIDQFDSIGIPGTVFALKTLRRIVSCAMRLCCKAAFRKAPFSYGVLNDTGLKNHNIKASVSNTGTIFYEMETIE